ncbi:TRAM domain-containing protein [Nakamurella sp. YIM 132087]|uniref:TRAM domain-containing protein n=1 Tax=Nakamurella alba TaxID=2665158 RepID=A0A7K1FQM0_9ACTN|nr:TRAM domain-containing protein [Nakamurella alba]MTD16441.1 TRAM domain-containing protein [Nakamurella alba]
MSVEEDVADTLEVGQLVDLEIGPVAHGGICVARYHRRVVFVRLALPGERVRVRLTEVRRGSFCRGEVVEVLQPSADRREAPCSHYGPAACGGCDLQHVSPDGQLRWKADVVAEQLHRLAGINRSVTVEALPGNGFGWRTRVRWALDPEGRIGPRAQRSHRVVPVGRTAPCLIAADGLGDLATVTEPPMSLLRAAAARAPHRGRGRGSRPVLPEVTLTRDAGGRTHAVWEHGPDVERITEHAVGRDFSVAADGFWQVHPAAAETLAGAVREALGGRLGAGERAWDLYGGVGLFTEVLHRCVGDTGTVVSVEGDRTASALAQENVGTLPGVQVVQGDVAAAVAGIDGTVDAIVLDPPRTGAGQDLCRALAGRGARTIVYVACDPAALGRDTAVLLQSGYALASLRAFDCFPQTHHVECVAVFVSAGSAA